jgi:hypothetical protein
MRAVVVFSRIRADDAAEVSACPGGTASHSNSLKEEWFCMVIDGNPPEYTYLNLQ